MNGVFVIIFLLITFFTANPLYAIAAGLFAIALEQEIGKKK